MESDEDMESIPTKIPFQTNDCMLNDGKYNICKPCWEESNAKMIFFAEMRLRIYG